MAKKFMQTFLIAAACKELDRAGKTTSIRDLYYMTKHTIGDTKQNTFDEQDESDPIIEDLEVTIDALREELHLFASKRGTMVGPITIVDSGDTIDLRRMGSGGWSVPSIVEEHVIQFKKCEAKYILLVEKDAVWRRFNEDKFWQQEKCIIVTGQGQPPRGVRRLFQRMHRELKLPVYVLVDNDPWGFYIYSVVKQGSINLAYESVRMAVPDARFIGLSAFDQVTLPARQRDHQARRPGRAPREADAGLPLVPKHWQREIQQMLRSGVKFELEALSRRGSASSPRSTCRRSWRTRTGWSDRRLPAGGLTPAPQSRLTARAFGCEPEEEEDMAAIKGNRSKKKNANRSKVKRVAAKRKRALSVKRKRK